MYRILTLVPALAIMLALDSTPAIAVDSDPAPAANSDLDAGRKAIQAKDWNAALRSLAAAERREPRNADVQNLLGYAYRNSGKLDLAFKYYERALQLDPGHRGAHEYAGEAYLMANNPAKAEEHLAALRKLCSQGCAERDDLAKQIAEFRRRTAAAK
jgi:Flp pilus assembly protein TadD